LDKAALQARIDAIAWYHEFDFGNGLKARSKTPDVEWHRRNWQFIEQHLGAIDFRDKSVLDVGCWDGYWSFFAERGGAKSVLAVDDFSQNWANAEGIELAKELLGSKIDIEPARSAYDLASLGRTFDVVMLLGVYYHLRDAFLAFALLRHCCHAETIVAIEGSEAVGLPSQAAFLGLPPSRFLPANGALESLLTACYFSVTSRAEMVAEESLDPLGWRWRLRMAWQALVGSRSGVAALIEPMVASRRVFLTCRPMEFANAAHAYRPPFGLHRYDPRFGSTASVSSCVRT
jgi:tRNA (mo5U34)-methyltransferase